MTAEKTLSCRDCGIRAGTRDTISSSAEAYTCSRCLMAANEEKAPTTADVTRNTGGPGEDSGSRYIRPVRAVGRPRSSLLERRRKTRERVQAYRLRQRAERLPAADAQRGTVMAAGAAEASSAA